MGLDPQLELMVVGPQERGLDELAFGQQGVTRVIEAVLGGLGPRRGVLVSRGSRKTVEPALHTRSGGIPRLNEPGGIRRIQT
jgi:hypothetical protein